LAALIDTWLTVVCQICAQQHPDINSFYTVNNKPSATESCVLQVSFVTGAVSLCNTSYLTNSANKPTGTELLQVSCATGAVSLCNTSDLTNLAYKLTGAELCRLQKISAHGILHFSDYKLRQPTHHIFLIPLSDQMIGGSVGAIANFLVLPTREYVPLALDQPQNKSFTSCLCNNFDFTACIRAKQSRLAHTFTRCE
jgi:hypothetical protein